MLRSHYANKLRRFYANKLRNHYAIITQINYADFTQINYAIITQSLRMLRSHYANKLRRFYANKLRNSLRRLRNSITQIRLRNSPKCHYADYANTDFHYAKIQFITQWATCWCMQPVAKPNRKCCVNGKVESGALKNFFLGSESVLLHSTLER